MLATQLKGGSYKSMEVNLQAQGTVRFGAGLKLYNSTPKCAETFQSNQ